MAQRLSNRNETQRKKSGGVGKVIGTIFGFYSGAQLLASGIVATAALGPGGIPFIILGAVILFLVVFSMVSSGKKNRKKQETADFSTPRQVTNQPRPTETRSFSFRGDNHQHILAAGISVEKRLEQLDTLYHAGLYTKEQYLLEKQKIKSRG